VLTIESSLAKYPAKILPKAKKIKGIVMRMGASWHCKMSCFNKFVGAIFSNMDLNLWYSWTQDKYYTQISITQAHISFNNP